MNLFNNSDFYPTPTSVIETMCAGIDLSGKRALEPSAGSGNIVDYLKTFGADVMACEIDQRLARIIGQKCRFLKPDFLKVEAHEISHIDYIIMNPPFSADEKHIIHAWNIAPEGCQIVALCNWETLANARFRQREQLKRIADENGNYQNLGDVFSDAERKTGVEIGLIRLFKPRAASETEFDGYFDMTEDEEAHNNGIMQYSEIRNIVNRYVGAVKMFDSVQEVSNSINALINPISAGLGIEFGAHTTNRNNMYSKIDRETFKKQLQKSAWRSIFNKMNMDKYVTQKVIADLNAFIEKQSNVPFTVKNVYLMIEMIAGTHVSRLNGVLVEAFERICGYSYDNHSGGEGWKTNSDYKVNRRFIHPYMCEYDTRWPSEVMKVRYDRGDQMDDIVKALCLLTGEKYEDQIPLRTYFDWPYHLVKEDGKTIGGYNNCFQKYDDAQRSVNYYREKEGLNVTIRQTGREWGQWYEWGFFRVRGYKKGTMHFEFKDEKVWEKFNRKVAEIKGWALPKQTDTKKKGTERRKGRGVEIYEY